MQINFKFNGQVVTTTVPSLAVGQIVNVKAGGQTIRLYWDGVSLVPHGTHLEIVEGLPASAVDKTEMPEWVECEKDPRIVYLREQADGNARFFFDALYETAWSDALLLKGQTNTGADLAKRMAELDAGAAQRNRRAAAHWRDVRDATSDLSPEDVVVNLKLKGEQAASSDGLDEDSERDDDYGQEEARVIGKLDALADLQAYAGLSDPAGYYRIMARIRATQAQEKTPKVLGRLKRLWEELASHGLHDEPVNSLEDVIASLAVARLTEREKGIVARCLAMGVTEEVTEVCFVMPDGTKRLGDRLQVIRTHNRMVKRALWNQWEIDQAIDRWESDEAARDEVAHPDEQQEMEPKVEVSIERQAAHMEWIADKSTKGKPWLGRPTYLSVYHYALGNGARTPKVAHNRAYAADTMRLPERILGFDEQQGWLVLLNKEKHQTGLVPLADARVVFQHLPKGSKDKMRDLVKQ